MRIAVSCGTPAPGMRRETQTLDEALEPLAIGRTTGEAPDAGEDGEEPGSEGPEPYAAVEEGGLYPDLDLDLEPLEEE